MDRYYARITFPAEALNYRVAELLNQDEVYYYKDDSVIIAETSNAPWGEFEELEAYFVKKGVPFDRFSGAHIEIMPCLRRFRPPNVDVTLNVIEDGGIPVPYVTVPELRRLLGLPPDELEPELKILINRVDPPLPPVEP